MMTLPTFSASTTALTSAPNSGMPHFVRFEPGLAVPGEIEGDHPVTGGEGLELAVVEAAVGQSAVDEDEGRLARPAAE